MKWLVKLAVKRGLPAWVIPLLIYVVVAAFVAWLYGYIYDSGVISERERWKNKETVELVKRQNKILELTTLNRELERASNLRAISLQTVYEGMLQDEKTRANNIIASATAVGKRLSIPTRQTLPACASGVSTVAASQPTVTSEARAELSTASSEFLIALGREADQAVIESNSIKDELMNCRAHVEALRQSVSQSLTPAGGVSDLANGVAVSRSP